MKAPTIEGSSSTEVWDGTQITPDFAVVLKQFIETQIGNGGIPLGVLNALGFSADGVPGITQNVVLAKLTPTGTEGLMTFHEGLLTAYTAPT